MAKSKDNRKRRCPECEKKFEAKRLDMKFCSQHCRNRCNNRKVRITKVDTISIDTILHRNYQILKYLGQTKISRGALSELGFNFKYITRLQRTKGGVHHYFLYHFYYSFGKNNIVYISLKE